MLRLPVFQTIYRWKPQKVFLSLNDEIQNVRDVADDAGVLNYPLLKELVRRKQHVNQVMARIEMANIRRAI